MKADRNPPIYGTAATLQGPQYSGHTIASREESSGGLLPRLLRRRFTTTLRTAIDTGLAGLKAEAEQGATP
jgi:hypothetical protein